jgi:hypothetical protein
MNEQIAERIVGSLDKVQHYIDSAEGFVLEQAPLVAQEIVLIGRTQAAVTVACFVFASLAFAGMFVYSRKQCRDCGDMSDWPIASFIIGLGTVASCGMTMLTLNIAILPFLAPRLYLLQEVSKLL